MVRRGGRRRWWRRTGSEECHRGGVRSRAAHRADAAEEAIMTRLGLRYLMLIWKSLLKKNKKSEILAESSVFQEFAQSLPRAGVALSGAPPSERSTQNRARLSATSSQTQKKRNSGVELQDDDYMSEGTGTAVSQASAPSPNTGRWPLQAASVASVGRLLTVLQCP